MSYTIYGQAAAQPSWRANPNVFLHKKSAFVTAPLKKNSNPCKVVRIAPRALVWLQRSGPATTRLNIRISDFGFLSDFGQSAFGFPAPIRAHQCDPWSNPKQDHCILRAQS
jgi:hypothetical protein